MLPMSCVTSSAFCDLQRVEHARDVVRLLLLVVAAVRLRREPHAAQVGHDDRVVFDERRRERPHMSPVSPKPCSITTAGPEPPTRTWMLAPSVGMSCMRKLAG